MEILGMLLTIIFAVLLMTGVIVFIVKSINPDKIQMRYRNCMEEEHIIPFLENKVSLYRKEYITEHAKFCDHCERRLFDARSMHFEEEE